MNVALSMVTAPLNKSGPCSSKRATSTRLVWAKHTSVAQSSGTESVKAESMAVWA